MTDEHTGTHRRAIIHLGSVTTKLLHDVCTGGGDSWVLDTNYQPPLTVGRRPPRSMRGEGVLGGTFAPGRGGRAPPPVWGPGVIRQFALPLAPIARRVSLAWVFPTTLGTSGGGLLRRSRDESYMIQCIHISRGWKDRPVEGGRLAPLTTNCWPEAPQGGGGG